MAPRPDTASDAPILGIGGSNHDFSAAIVRGGSIVVAVEDERIQRVKNAKRDWCAHPAQDATRYCLDAAGLDLEDLDGIFCSDDIERPSEWMDWSRVTFVNHHTAHAAAAFFTSPHDSAALLVVDGHGGPLSEDGSGYEVETISVGRAGPGEFEVAALQTGVQKKTSSSWQHVTQNSIGWFYEIITSALGFGESGQGKTMGLAAYGSSIYRNELQRFVEIDGEGRFWFDPYSGIWDWLTQTIASSRNSFQVRANIAESAQEIFIDAIVAAAAEAHRRAPNRVLAFGGGCALNTLANSQILERTPFEAVSVFPASGDNGLAVGVALYGAHVVLGQTRAVVTPGWRARAVFTGREYSPEDVDAALDGAPVHATRSPDLVGDVGTALANGQTVAMCRGRSEIGPRALGHRSLLASPRTARMRDHINLNVKERESFRPLAPVVPLEHLDTYFEDVAESPYMLFVATVREKYRDQLAAVTHIDGTARVQTVREEDDPFLHELLERVGDITGIPVLLNTSLNLRGEPIVETPQDAVALFVQSPIDVLVLGDRLVRKYTPWADVAGTPGPTAQGTA